MLFTWLGGHPCLCDLILLFWPWAPRQSQNGLVSLSLFFHDLTWVFLWSSEEPFGLSKILNAYIYILITSWSLSAVAVPWTKKLNANIRGVHLSTKVDLKRFLIHRVRHGVTAVFHLIVLYLEHWSEVSKKAQRNNEMEAKVSCNDDNELLTPSDERLLQFWNSKTTRRPTVYPNWVLDKYRILRTIRRFRV